MKSKITKEQIVDLMKEDLMLKQLADRLDISQQWTIKLLKKYELNYYFKKNQGSNSYWKGKNLSDETKRKISESKKGKGKKRLPRKIVNCPICNKEYKIVVGAKNRSLNSKYCSRKCADIAHSNLLKERFDNKDKVYTVCDNCGKEFYKPQSLIHYMNFCSRKCQSEWRSGKTYEELYDNAEEIKTKIMIQTIDNNKNMPTISKPHKILRQAMIDNNLYKGFETSKRLYLFEIDELNKNKKIIIEIDGDYWHANPMFYGGYLTPLNEQQQKKQIADKRKNTYLSNKGYKIMRFWEYDIYNNLDNCIAEIREVLDA